MKKLTKIFTVPAILAVLVMGCNTLLDVDSDRLVYPDDHELNSPNDTIFSMIGIFTQLEKLADRYILLGELRGDLMDVTSDAGPFLQEINHFRITADNPFNRQEDYYAVINHCNYLITNIDTALTANAEKVMYKEFAAAKAIRAWTYMQLALNHGTVQYYTEPVLYVNKEVETAEYTLDALVPELIDDLAPWTDVDLPGGISLGADLSSDILFFPVRMVLGELYLWNGDYEKAAGEFYALIQEETYTIDDFFQSLWEVDNGVFVSREPENQGWPYIFTLTNYEQITLIAGSAEFGEGAYLDSITWFDPEIVPSSVAIDTWNNQTYYHTASVQRAGDLRGDMGSYLRPESSPVIETNDIVDVDRTMNQITKFTTMATDISRAVPVYRVAMLYLRYAEAVNRAGKPNLAFAVLKHGMSSGTLAVDSIVPRREKYLAYTDTTGVFFDYVFFEDLAFTNNIGVHALGCGNVELSADFKIPSLSGLQDSILFVEEKIIEELALETAFEGNRFHDLMRIAVRRNDPAFLADRVAEKHTDNQEAIRSILMDESNWYLPMQ